MNIQDQNQKSQSNSGLRFQPGSHTRFQTGFQPILVPTFFLNPFLTFFHHKLSFQESSPHFDRYSHETSLQQIFSRIHHGSTTTILTFFLTPPHHELLLSTKEHSHTTNLVVQQTTIYFRTSSPSLFYADLPPTADSTTHTLATLTIPNTTIH